MNRPKYDPAVPLTERQALELTWDMWHWLSLHPMQDKHDYLNQHQPETMLYVANHCFCCEYIKQKFPTEVSLKGFLCAGGRGRIDFCPLGALWPTGCEEGGPWLDWLDTEPVESYRLLRVQAANAIADACQERLSEMNKAETVEKGSK